MTLNTQTDLVHILSTRTEQRVTNIILLPDHCSLVGVAEKIVVWSYA